MSDLIPIEDILDHIKDKDIGFDLETTGFDPFKDQIVGFAISTTEKDFWIPLGSGGYPYVETCNKINVGINKVSRVFIHNAKFDLKFCEVAGIHITAPVACSYIGALLLNDDKTDSKTLDALSEKHLGEKKLAEFKEVGTLFGPSMGDYAKQDSKLHLRLAKEYILPELKKEKLEKLFWELEMPVLRALVETELAGVDIDIDHLKKLEKEYGNELKEVEQEIYEQVGKDFNIRSGPQLSEILFDEMKFPKEDITKETKREGTYSTGVEVLKRLYQKTQSPLINNLLKYRALFKTHSSFLVPLIEEHVTSEGKIHANFLQLGAKARMSCRGPNLQQWTRDAFGIRKALTGGEDGYLIQADYSSIEVRLSAWFAKDPALIKLFKEGRDPYAEYAKIWGITRQEAKSSFLGFTYGLGAKKFSNVNKIHIEKAKKYRKQFFKAFPTYRTYFNEVHESLRKFEYVKSFIGRRRRFPGYRKEAWRCHECFKGGVFLKSTFPLETKFCPNCLSKLSMNWEGAAVNFPIQGSAADLIRIAYRNLREKILEKRKQDSEWEKVVVVSLIHDEMLVKSPKDIATDVRWLVQKTMEEAIDIGFPIKSEAMIVRNWGESKLNVKERLALYLDEGLDDTDIEVLFDGNYMQFDQAKKELLAEASEEII